VKFVRRCPTHRDRDLNWNLDCPEGHHPMGQHDDGTYVDMFLVMEAESGDIVTYVTGLECVWTSKYEAMFEGLERRLSGRDKEGMVA
jgi:hypothetical protein